MPDEANDTSVSEPSTNEVSQDTDAESSLESIEVTLDDETEETEDSESESQDTEPAESEEESEEDVELEAEDAESSDEESAKDSTPSKEDRSKHNAEMAQRRIAEREARELAKQQQQDKYIEEAEDNRDLALRQLQIDAYNNRVEKHRNSLDNGIEKAIANIDLFRTGTPEVKEALASSLEKFERMHVKYDTNGDPMNVTGNVYEYLLKEADSIRTLLNIGARGQSKAKDKAKARTDTLPTRAPKEPKVDPDIAAFDEEASKWS